MDLGKRENVIIVVPQERPAEQPAPKETEAVPA